jgi:hypothetical protein
LMVKFYVELLVQQIWLRPYLSNKLSYAKAL